MPQCAFLFGRYAGSGTIGVQSRLNHVLDIFLRNAVTPETRDNVPYIRGIREEPLSPFIAPDYKSRFYGGG